MVREQEDRFTIPSSFCMKPQYWHSLDNESTEDEVSELVAALVRAIQPEFSVETGTAYGVTTYNIGKALLKNGHGKLVSLDSDGKMSEAATKNINDWKFQEGLEFIQLPIDILNVNSMEYTPPQDIDFAFFDSWQEGRAEEFLRFYNMGRLKRHTIIVFHDTAPHHQVHKYVDQLVEEGYIVPITLHTPRGVTIAQVL